MLGILPKSQESISPKLRKLFSDTEFRLLFSVYQIEFTFLDIESLVAEFRPVHVSSGLHLDFGSLAKMDEDPVSLRGAKKSKKPGQFSHWRKSPRRHNPTPSNARCKGLATLDIKPNWVWPNTDFAANS